ncbi:Tudor Domain-Containing Protein 7 [Manis pentadactyla]|nr:Tudor Domain-Containing Protein 7 [Manis pentadactyla]
MLLEPLLQLLPPGDCCGHTGREHPFGQEIWDRAAVKIVAPSCNYQCAQNPLKDRRGTAMRRTDVSSWKSLCPHNIVEEFKIGGREAAANEDCKRPEGMSSIEKVCQDKEGDPEEAVLRARLPAMPSRTWGSRKIRGISSERQSECALFLSYTV